MHVPKHELALLAVVAFSGCASWQKQGVSVAPPKKIRLAVLPLKLDFSVKNPAELATVAKSTATSAERKNQARAMKARLGEELDKDFELRVSSSYVFSPVPDADVDQAMASLHLSTSAEPTPKQYQELARSLKADALLRVVVHGYGKIKTSWLLLLWASSFGEGAAQGVVIAEAAANVWAGAAVAAEEVLQEGLEWFGGGYLFDRYYAPVILEGDLYSGKTGKNIWGWWFVDTENKKAVKKLPKAEQKKKEVRLLLTFEKARDEMMQKIERAAVSNEEAL